jgi:basic membrane protein A
MKKILMFAVLLAGAFTLASCQAAETTFKVAMVTDVGDIDDKSFNQGTWEGIVEWAEENDVSHKYYRPTADEDDARLAAIDLAVAGGAEIVVTPGFMFEVVIYTAQTKYPDVKFVLIDGAPHAGDYATYETTANTKSILFKENESGFLAGYASVMEGYRELGFMGGIAVPAVVRFGLGYVAGAYHAARELGATTWEFDPAYYAYLGGFGPTDEIKNQAASWYSNDVEIIHVAAGGAGNSVMLAAEESESGMVVGVDVDQAAQSPKVITSAMKALGVVVKQALTEWQAGTFQGGETVTLGAAEEAVGLPLGESFRFTTFTEAQYEEILGKLVDGSVVAPFTVDEFGEFLEALGVGTAQVSALMAAVSGE